ncbi:2-keto-3-deoxy-phosphogluconate aldolase [Planomicrobium soli]|uniref:2-keto-3-deoxy-phosphogluconate aldolase n=1 Tax=Planomicrobium soli TaxID=1176648 RepID=A0A2P8H1U5_9BACL|nr:bifunctional 4-hydroxy-2-oxoglutarate aldolase/2-dehydro-3-deoxy-phosphogluconate aldolase [Planomicrobium soli]PSL40186.1 2-keto-3-deoxy-phosphogluconate aldolase [Planomicrobium soli]
MNIDQLKSLPIIPVLRKIPYEKSEEIVQALFDGGIRAVEITMESVGAESMIRETFEKYGEKMLVGAGTVLSIDDCKRAIEAGAQFIVSPAFDEEVVAYAVNSGVPVIPGVFTPSEMLRADKAGALMVKLFPASVLGPSFIKDVKGPLGHIDIITTGGITKETAKGYLDAGAVAIGAGGALLKKELIEANDWDGIKKEAELWLKNLK